MAFNVSAIREIVTADKFPGLLGVAQDLIDKASGDFAFEPTRIVAGASQTGTFAISRNLYLCPCYFFSDNKTILDVSGYLDRDATTARVQLIGKDAGTASLLMILPNFVRPSGSLIVATIQVVTPLPRRRAVRR